MKILFLARRYYPEVGGVEKHLEMISNHLVDVGHEVSIITQQQNTIGSLQEKCGKAQVYRIPVAASDNKQATWSWIFKNRQLFDSHDIIHVHDVFWWSLPIFIKNRKKIYITFHGYEGSEEPNSRQKLSHWLAAKLTVANLCIGGFHKKWYGVKSNAVSYGAVKLSSKSLNLDQNKNKIIFIGRLEEDNGVREYLQAINILKKNGHTYHLDIYGDGYLRDELESFAKLNKLNVTFYGFVENASQYLDNYYIGFVTRYLAIIEALASEVNVISIFRNRLQYDYLVLSPFKNWIHITSNAKEIADVILNPKHKDRKVARDWANAQTWEKMTDTYLKLWKIK